MAEENNSTKPEEKEIDDINLNSSKEMEEGHSNRAETSENDIDQSTADKSEDNEKEKVEEKPVEMVEIPKDRLYELENSEAIALEEVKRERASAINYRKRLEKQRDEFAEIASARVLRKLLDASDDLNRIIENGKDNIPKDHLEGIKLLDQRIQGIFDSENVTILKVKEGKTRYDPTRHEAILTQPMTDIAPNTVLTMVSAGFVKGDRVLRPAKVIISQKPPEPVKEPAKEETIDNNTKEREEPNAEN